jgi:hypothetical protein
MASTQTWSEGNGATAATLTASRTDDNWKNIDDSTTVYSTSPITAGNNSFGKYQCIVFAGTYNTLSSLTYKIDNNSPATGISIVGSVVTSGTTPATTATGDSAASTTGAAANFNTSSSPYGTGTTTYTTGGTVYANMFRTQLQTLSTASPGDIGSRTITAAWTES